MAGEGVCGGDDTEFDGDGGFGWVFDGVSRVVEGVGDYCEGGAVCEWEFGGSICGE